MKKIAKLFLSLSLGSAIYFGSMAGASADTYKVAKGDTLYKIAKKYNTTYQAIMKENGLKSDKIKIGQKLKINEKNAAKTTAAKKTSKTSTTSNKTTVTTTKVAAKPAKNTQGERIIAEAKKYLGVPYRYGGYSPKGFDCAGYVAYVYNKSGKKITRSSAANYYSKAKKVSNPQVGDLVFFSNTYKKGISHVGIYMGNGKMINASGKKVQIVSLSSSYWKKHFTGYGRI